MFYFLSEKSVAPTVDPAVLRQIEADRAAQSPQTRGEYLLSCLGSNKEGFLTRVKLAIQGFFTKGAMGSAQRLLYTTAALEKNPNDASIIDFYAALKARVVKINSGFNLSQDVEMMRSCVTAIVPEQVQAATLKKIAQIELESFAQFVTVANLPSGAVQSEIETKSAALAALVGDAKTAETFETQIKALVFAAFETSLPLTLDPAGLTVRTEAEVSKLNMLKAHLDAANTSLFALTSNYTLNQPVLAEAQAAAQQVVKKISLEINKPLAELTEALTALIDNGVKMNVDCSSQKAFLNVLVNMTSDKVLEELTKEKEDGTPAGYTHQSLRELMGQLSALSTFLDSKELAKLSGNKRTLQSIVAELTKRIEKDFAEANEALRVATANVKDLDSQKKALEEKRNQLSAELTTQETMIADQKALDEYAVASEAYNAQGLVARLNDFFLPLTSENPEVPEARSGGVAALVAKELKANQALYEYLEPKVVRSWTNTLSGGFFGK